MNTKMVRRPAGRAGAVAVGALLGMLMATGAAQARVPDRDEWVETKAKLALLDAEDVGAGEISVEAEGGLVILRGTVDTEEERRLAASVIGELDGVGEVRNEIEVRSPEPVAYPGDDAELLALPTDAEHVVHEDERELMADVDEALLADDRLSRTTIHAVSAAGGVVLLGGEADLLDEELLAVEIAQSVRGVDGVMSEVFTLDVDEGATPRYEEEPELP